MRLTEILRPENVKLPIAATGKTEAIEELLALLETNGDLSQPAKVREAVLERERTRTTGIGDGMAIPHGKTDGVTSLTMAFGRTADPIDFESVDGKPVSLIWLLTSPADQTHPHVVALGRVSKILSQPAVRRRLLDAKSARAIYDIIAEQDEQV